MTELRNTEREICALSPAPGRGGAVRPVRLRPARRAPRLPADRQARRALDPGREQPHRGRADHAQPRPDPRPQRRRPGQQLLGLHARDRAGARSPTSTRRSTSWPRSSTSSRATASASSACSRRAAASSRCRSARSLNDEEVARFTAQKLPLRRRRDQGAALPQLSARRGRQPPDRLHRPHQPDREEADGGRLGRRRPRQLPRHRVHRQARRRAELRERAARRRPASRRSR